MSQRPLHIGWKVAALDSRMASVRYRALLPILALNDLQCTSQIFDSTNPSRLDGLDALVFVKSFGAEDLYLAQEASLRGIPVILDLCDNIFISAYQGEKGHLSPADAFAAMASLAGAVVTTTQPLAEKIRAALGDVPVYVIPDGVETPDNVAAATQLIHKALQNDGGIFQRKILKAAYAARRQVGFLRQANWRALSRRLGDILGILRSSVALLAMWVRRRVRNILQYLRVHRTTLRRWGNPRFLAKEAYNHFARYRAAFQGRPSDPSRHHSTHTHNVKRIIWFGNHGAPYARFGMLDLLEIRTALETVARKHAVEMVVVSNNRMKYEKHISTFHMPTRYVRWTPKALERWLAKAAVAVIPNTRDDFSLCKSANRTVLALTRGVPVVATSTPALEPLASCITTDDFEAGLLRYLDHPEKGRDDVANSPTLIEEHFGQPLIGRSWRGLVDLLLVKKHTLTPFHSQPQMVVALNLIQDFDLALPILHAARQKDITIQVWCSTALLQKSPRTLNQLRAGQFDIRLLSNTQNIAFPSSVRALLTMAETNLQPHCFTRALSKAAKNHGIFVATLQHGFENVGLTYDDSVHPIDRIDFLADRIYLWGRMETLHPRIPLSTRVKCEPAGCPKPVVTEEANLSGLIPPEKKVVGIFENLHWHRYSKRYRFFFMESVKSLARAFPDILFLVKPHHAGLWLTSQYRGKKLQEPNLIIADPRQSMWESYTAPALLGRMCAVITTPSTVALDAARLDLPVAVVERMLHLENYAPLTRLVHAEDWANFVHAALDPKKRAVLEILSRQFVEKVLIPGDAATHIIEDVCSSNGMADASWQKKAS